MIKNNYPLETSHHCNTCEILARSIIAIEIDQKEIKYLLKYHFKELIDLWKCISLILHFDLEEEENGPINLEEVAEDFKKELRIRSIKGQSPIELVVWKDRFFKFVNTERYVALNGHCNINTEQWYKQKCVDVMWIGYQILRIMGHSVLNAEIWIDKQVNRFIALEIYDDVIDNENKEMWEKLSLKLPFKLGTQAKRASLLFCPGLHNEFIVRRTIINQAQSFLNI